MNLKTFKWVIAFFVPGFVSGQCSMVPVSLSERIELSEIIVEATITDQYCFRDRTDNHIYTANNLKVYKIFKGNLSQNELVLISPGGIIGEDGESLHPSIYVNKAVTGMFFLIRSPVGTHSSNSAYEAFSGPQGCIYYDKINRDARDVFGSYSSIEIDVYRRVMKETGLAYREVAEVDFFPEVSMKSALPKIKDVSPLSVAAGTREAITITGSNFGNLRGSGSVEFTNASTGPSTVVPENSQYLIWQDTMIKVEVPSGAGSGMIRVIQSGSAIYTGLVVRFAQLNIEMIAKPIPTLHINNDGSGGFVWRMSNAFSSNTNAKNRCVEAMITWSNVTCINWSNGPATAINADQKDGFNNIRFGDSGELPSGVLGHTRNYWSNCTSSFGYAVEIDLTFDPDRTWNFDASNPSIGESDFASVCVHELGHAHQLGHVTNTADAMYPTIAAGTQKRNLVDDDMEGGISIMLRSTSAMACGPGPMKKKSACQLPIGIEESRDRERMNIFPNPASEWLNIQVSAAFPEARIAIRNVQGSIVFSGIPDPVTGMLTWQIPGDLSRGLYYITITSGNQTYNRKALLGP